MFNNGGELSLSASPFLTNSKDLVYLEQELVVRELEKVGKQHYLLVGELNLQTIAELHQIGMFDEDEFVFPKKPSQILLEKGYFDTFGLRQP